MGRTVELKWKGQTSSAQLGMDKHIEGTIFLVQATASAMLLIWSGENLEPVLRELNTVLEIELIADVSPCQPSLQLSKVSRPVQDGQIQPRAQVTKQVCGGEAEPGQARNANQ